MWVRLVPRLACLPADATVGVPGAGGVADRVVPGDIARRGGRCVDGRGEQAKEKGESGSLHCESGRYAIKWLLSKAQDSGAFVR
ncbi:predicted protein [Chaetomium globosum CBS 148.51]|uniref:Uncharacterized protein n=1 Tax=Chaetomium globosum (strain ATCC 6205 / CBS 148.51 / DSM 1962 / NBRC 6347 / NRRL 1970) TaxID=306901 RepID=Q2GM29_CHAGB|nr:uncharacterized protein CHGG_10975 [Chaetomium globosum CBS 148.51]EAQ83157.1 predicted protein [Chaetomium globosum CBS 148.51]